MGESFRFPKPIPRDTTEKIAVAMTENMRSLEVWLNSILVPEAEGAADDHDDLTNVTTSQHHARYTDGEAVAAVGAGGSYLPLAGGTMTGHIVLDANVPATIQIVENGRWSLIDHAGSGVFSWSDVTGDFSFAGIATPGTSLRWDDSDNQWEFRDKPTFDGTLAADMSDLTHDHDTEYSATTHNHDATYLELDGTNEMSGPLDMGGQYIKDSLGQSAYVYISSAQSIVTSTDTAVSWTVFGASSGLGGDWDDVGGSNPTRLTVPTAGTYLAVGQAYWNLAAGDDYMLTIWVNGSATLWRTRNDAADAFVRDQVVAPLILAANDYVELYVWHNNGSNRDLRGAQSSLSLTQIA